MYYCKDYANLFFTQLKLSQYNLIKRKRFAQDLN